MPERFFSAPYDSTTKGVTALTCVLLLVVAFIIHVIFVALLIPLLVALAYAYSPRGYVLSGHGILVKRLIGNIRVPRGDIREIRPGTPADLAGCIRLWGSGGFFGYYGLFRTSKLGRSYWYVTDRSKTVIVVARDKTFVLSPDDVLGFVAVAGMPPAGAVGAEGSALPSRSVRNYMGLAVGLGIAVLAVVLVALSIVYAPGPPPYTLAGSSLTIHDRFYPVTLQASAVDAGNIRIVDLTRDSEWRPTLRTNGFANQHYQSGWFRVASGKTVRLYRAGGRRLVLIPPKGSGTYVLYQAKDPEAFVQQLRHWASS